MTVSNGGDWLRWLLGLIVAAMLAVAGGATGMMLQRLDNMNERIANVERRMDVDITQMRGDIAQIKSDSAEAKELMRLHMKETR